MNIIQMKVKDIIPYEKNAKAHDKVQIDNVAESIKRFGFAQPLVVDKDNVLIIGHCRLLAAKKLKIREVPTVKMDEITDEQVRQLRLLDNKLNESDWEFDILADDLDGLDFDGFDIDWGLSLDSDDETEISEDEVPDIDEGSEPIAKIGDVYQLGNHRLICGDSTDKDVIERLMDGVKADISFTSPPYNVGNGASLTGNTHMTECKYQNGNDDLSDYDELLIGATDNMLMFSKWSFINLQMLSNNKRIIIEWLNNYKELLCDIAIWYKTTTAPVIAKRVMNSQFEFVFIFSKENNSRAIGTKDFRGTVSNVYKGLPQRNNEYASIHSATFPIDFVSHFIGNFTNESDIVLDVFGGTGTTLIACEQLNRKCYMAEIDPRYVDVIIARWEKLTGKKALRIED